MQLVLRFEGPILIISIYSTKSNKDNCADLISKFFLISLRRRALLARQMSRNVIRLKFVYQLEYLPSAVILYREPTRTICLNHYFNSTQKKPQIARP